VLRRRIESRRTTAALLAAALALAAALGASCAHTGDGENLKLPENIYGLYLGETKADVFARARGVATVTTAPDVPPGSAGRGEMYILSAPLEPYQGIDHIRLSFLRNRLWEIVVYYRDVSPANLDYLKLKLEGLYGTRAAAPDGTIEQAYKTYRLAGPGMSITLRRITKRTTTELYVQYIHDELHRRLAAGEHPPR